jgi:hypothetical protein
MTISIFFRVAKHIFSLELNQILKVLKIYIFLGKFTLPLEISEIFNLNPKV